jgi:sialic acid synthase SpsE
MTLIIAEAGVNHNGRKDLAFKLIDVAHSAGADIVKFQTFKASKVVTKYAEQAKYQTKNTKKKETQLSMLKKLELPYEAHFELMTYCEKLGIEFLSTAFDEESFWFTI